MNHKTEEQHLLSDKAAVFPGEAGMITSAPKRRVRAAFVDAVPSLPSHCWLLFVRAEGF